MKEPINKTLLYSFDPEIEKYEYNCKHGTQYPYNSFPPGMHGRVYKKTRFIDWEPKDEDIIIRHHKSRIFVNFEGLFPNDLIDPVFQFFQMRAARLKVQNFICEQINFYTALYDDDNDLVTSMLIAKYVTDSQTYTIATFEEYYIHLVEILFPPKTMEKITKMINENNVGDDIVGLFPLDFLRDMYIVSFIIKVMHMYLEHFIISTGNAPKDLYELFAKAYTYVCNKINPNMYVLLYNYVNKSVKQSVSSNSNIYDLQAIEGVTAPTTTQFVMRKILLCDGLIKLTFASDWDNINKRPAYSCVGLIKSVISKATFLTRKTQLRYSLVNIDDISRLLSDTIDSKTPISMIRSFNAGEYSCMIKDLNIIIAQIALELEDLSHLDYYTDNLVVMNDLSKILLDTVLYNKFHSSISPNTLSTKQKMIMLLYVRKIIMDIYGLLEEDTVDHPLINILMGKTVFQATRSLTQKDISSVKKYVKISNLKEYLLFEKNVNMFVENIIKCVLSSYTIVNHNNNSLLDTKLVYESGSMTLSLLDMIVELFEFMKR